MLKVQWVALFVALLDESTAVIRDPWIENHVGFMEKKDCEKIIQESESVGFSTTADSIDYGDERAAPAMDVEVVLEGEILVPSIATLYDKYLPKIRELVVDRKFKMNNGDTSEPTLDWVFLRKYTAGEERRMLKLHHDVNLFTVNIGLNDDFEGGGLFYHRDDSSYYLEGRNIPNMPPEKLSYEYIDAISRVNTTELVFPIQNQGDLIIHNHTLYHAIAPIHKGTRYALVFFYDMGHPDVQRYLKRPVQVKIYNNFDFPVDLYMVDPTKVELTLELEVEDLDRVTTFEGMGNTEYRIIRTDTREPVDTFSVFDDDVVDAEGFLVFRVGGEDESDQHLVVHNTFDHPVSIYWINPDSVEGERQLIDDVMEPLMALDSTLGHQFVVVHRETGEDLATIEVTRDEEENKSTTVVVGPGKEHLDEGEL